MRENTTRILKQAGGVGHYFFVSLAVERGERAVRFAQGVDDDTHVRFLITEAIGVVLEYLPREERGWGVSVTDFRWTAVDTTDDQVMAGTIACLGELLLASDSGKIRLEYRDGRWHAFLNEWQLYPLSRRDAPLAVDISRAVALYFGWKIAPYPDQDESRVIKNFGSDVGHVLLERVYAIQSDIDRIEPDRRIGHDLDKTISLTIHQILLKHPELGGEAPMALRWYYSYKWKRF